jgi:uncharacterized protein YjlB
LYCKGEEPIEKLKKEVESVDIPERDPVFGVGGPLVKIWKGARG